MNRRTAARTPERRSRVIFLAIAGLTVAAAAVALPAQGAAATTVRCGQTLTASVRLANDLTGCSGDGLVIGAAHITVDLAGHSIAGANTAGSEGIADDGHPGVRVANGTISGFFLDGIGLRGAPHSTVSNVTVRAIGAGGADPNTSAGVLIKDSPHTTVSGSTVSNAVTAFQSDGVDVLSSANTTIAGNRIVDNNWDGMFVLESPGARIVGNALDGSGNEGTEVNLGSGHAVFAHNRARNNKSDGLAVGAVTNVSIMHNRFNRNGGNGLFMFNLRDSRIVGNLARGNNNGFDLAGGDPSQPQSSHDVLLRNDASRNQTGIVLEQGARENALVANEVSDNLGAPGNGGGIVVVNAAANLITRNRADRNHDTGIAIFADTGGDASGNVLAANVANSNRNHGMVAISGTIDGGRNRAHHNTPLPNCLGLICR